MEVVLFVVEKIWDRVSQEYETFQGVQDQVTELKSNLNLLKSFLKDADAKKHTSEVVRNCVEEIKEIVYDAEDIIESFILKEKLKKLEKKSGIMKRIKRFSSTIVDRRELASDIGRISKRIFKVTEDMEKFGVQKIMIADGSQSSHLLKERQRQIRKEFARSYENNLVGMEANVKKLVGYLVEEDDIQIVSVTGMGGLGKTTLARQVFNHDDVKHQFTGLAWVCVSQDLNRISVWQTILQSFRPSLKEKKILEMTESTLQDELFEFLETTKSLIVLDDIWKDEDWDLIKPIFPPNKGWKVLLTSRKENIVMLGDTQYINLRPDCLSSSDSWTLFQRIAMPRKDASKSKVDEEMEEMGKQMVKHCGGLPLAIRVLGGLLAENNKVHDWIRVSENMGSHLVEKTSSKNGSIDKVLSMSFEELPSYLKQCFLYLAHFPEDHTISVENLSYYWAAERIFEPRHYNGEAIRDVGDRCIEELVKRNMVISQKSIYTLRYETCHLHDMMREISLFKAKEENFLQMASNPPSTTNFQPSGTSRRFVSQYPATLDIERDINSPKLRSIVVVRVNNACGGMWKLSGSSFKSLELLRVLDLFKAVFEEGILPSGIGKLVHLRYLSLKRAKVSHLPVSLGNLLLLIYLNLNLSNSESIFVPNVLMRMEELRYLALPKYMHQETKLELSKLLKLETLENFSTKNGSVEDLRGMVRLRTLTMKLTEETSIETLSASIGGLRHLEYLDINQESERNVEEGIELDFNHLKHLSLSMYLPKLPKKQHFPSHLTILNLCYCGLEEDPMRILEKLLHLNEVNLMYKSFSGRRMVCSSSGFPQLQKLYVYGVKYWEEWIVEEGSMPLLHTLKIWDCKKLKELPDGLRFIYSLKELSMYKEWKERLSEGGEDYYKVKHIPSVKYREDMFQ